MEKKLEIRRKELTDRLLSDMNREGFWDGKLSSSALSTAVAVAALHFMDSEQHAGRIAGGLAWLVHNINEDGSYGDTPDSPGNISTTLLVYAAVNLYATTDPALEALQQIMATWLAAESIEVRSDDVPASILARYGNDYTFSVPILAMCGLCAIPGDAAFNRIPQLPFELSLLPRKFYRMLKMSVVSYAIPALVAVGILVFRKKRSGRLVRWARSRSVGKAMELLRKMLPESGGFLEAIPLTAFVAMSLICSGYREDEVTIKGIGFLCNTQREDGSWPIDVDLSTWVTTLSVKSLRSTLEDSLSDEQRRVLTNHLLSIQNRFVHPFNGTGPGGWGWTHFSGSVPDCDDTPGAIISLLKLNDPEAVRARVLAGCDWLLSLQNSDGGFPTFSRGWGKLPFDQSCSDLTGHCLFALAQVCDTFSATIAPPVMARYIRAITRAANYLQKNQSPGGAWNPLWFGNQQTPGHRNPVYGTARVMTYLQDALACRSLNASMKSRLGKMVMAGAGYLEKARNADGSWGGDAGIPGTIEETSLALSATLPFISKDAIALGFEWLEGAGDGKELRSSPIGLYFASLWYDEKLYPLVAYLEVLNRALEGSRADKKMSGTIE